MVSNTYNKNSNKNVNFIIMKRSIFTSVALIVLSVFFGSCTKEEITNNYYTSQQETSKPDEEVIIDGQGWWTTLEYVGPETGESSDRIIGYNYRIVILFLGDEGYSFWNPRFEGTWEIEPKDAKLKKIKGLTFNLSERNFKWFDNRYTGKHRFYGIYGEYTFFSDQFYETMNEVPKAKIKKGSIENNKKVYTLNTYPEIQFEWPQLSKSRRSK